ncbi:MAG TPA: hypothetical protein VHA75_06770 [Rugosimonospora sp.]|nr:hypothetical protein [Rugosimonospora sp.]
MDLTPYLDQLRRDLAASAAAGGPEISRAAELLAGALDASARLCLLEALSDAAAEITAHTGAVAVEVRLRGRDADLVVSEPAPPEPAAPFPPAAGPASAPPVDGGDLARITLRLPEPLKEQVERAATVAALSVNSWLVRAISSALAGDGTPGRGRSHGRRVTGWAQA